MAAVAEQAIAAEDQFGRCAITAEDQFGRCAIAAEDQFGRCETAAPAECQGEMSHLLSKLNPAAKEFFPSNYTSAGSQKSDDRLSSVAPVFVAASAFYGYGPASNGGSSRDSSSDGSANNQPNRRRRNGYDQGRWRMNDRSRRAEREDSIRRTVYVSDIDHQVTEEKLAEIFSNYGQVVDCRICGDPHSILRFAFIEFSDEYGARAALSLGGAVLGYYPVKVLPSKTAIVPVNPKFLPRSEDEKEMVIRTVYCTNIDKKVTQMDVKAFFEQHCGEVSRLRLLGDNVHSTRIAFVEFAQAESAIIALNRSGIVLGTLPIRVSPSKTPVRPRTPRSTSN